MNNKKNNRKGFTIVELVIVIAVIAILATVLVPTFGNVIEKANNSQKVQDLRNEYTDYVTKNAESEDFSDDIIIKLGNTYYQIEDGKVDIENTVTAEEAAAVGYWDGNALVPANSTPSTTTTAP